MTKAQLLEYAGENGVEGVSSSMRKADIIAVLEGADADGLR
nr:MAG TPA: dimeris T4 recombination endonuclease VII [Caudoviricetes sp.]